MTSRLLICALFAFLSSQASADIITFQTDFTEATLAATGLTIDTPNTNLATPDSGTVTLNTASDTLDLAANGANLWGNREGAPIAWVAAPTVAVGETWFAETQIFHTDSTGLNSEWDQAGITFYSGTAGSNPGNENPGNESLFLGVDDWNAWNHRVQGFADNNPNVSVGAGTNGSELFYRVEVTENGASDLYNFFYKENAADAWTQYGTTNLSQDFDNSVVGLYMKSHGNNTSATTAFNSFTVGTIEVVPEPSSLALLGLGCLGLLKRRRK